MLYFIFEANCFELAEHERRFISNNYYRITSGPFKEFIRNHGRYFQLLCRTRATLHEKSGRCNRLLIDIDRVQTIYSNIIEAQKRLREPLRPPNVDIARINERFVHSFYSGLLNDIRTLRKENDLPPAKMYEMIEKVNPEIEVKYRAQRAYTSSRRFPHYDSALPPSEE